MSALSVFKEKIEHCKFENCAASRAKVDHVSNPWLFLKSKQRETLETCSSKYLCYLKYKVLCRKYPIIRKDINKLFTEQ